LLHSSAIFSNSGYKVLFLGWSDANRKVPSIGTMNSVSDARITMKLLPRIQIPKADYIGLPMFFLWTVIRVLFFRPSVLYVSDAKACLIAYPLQWFFGAKLIFHEHDSFIVDKRNPHSRLVVWAKEKILKKAAIVVYPNECQKKRESKKIKKDARVFCVNNCPSLKEVESSSVPDKKDDVLRLYYHGGLSPALVPEALLFALAKTPKSVELVLVTYELDSARTYKKNLLDLSRKLNVSERFFIKGPMSRHEALKECSRCHVGIVLQPSRRQNTSLRYMLGASNKQYDYLACGLPLLVSNIKNWRDAYVKTGLAVACFPQNADSIAQAIGWFLQHPAERLRMASRARENILKMWNYENQFQPVIQEINKITRER